MTDPDQEVRVVGDDTVPVPRDDAGRTLRGCDVCRQVDSHPRHVLGVPSGWPGAVPAGDVLAALTRAAMAQGAADDAVTSMLAEQLDPNTVVRHVDCCAQAGCYDGSCEQLLAAAGRKRREALVEFVEARATAATTEET